MLSKGEDVIIGKRCIVKDCCLIKPDSVLADDTVVPPFTIWEGCPAKMVGKLSPTFLKEQEMNSTSIYSTFIIQKRKK